MKILLAALGLACASPALAEDLIWFRAPSNNIHCVIDTGWSLARCDILQVAKQSFRTPPADCDLDWGHAFEITATGRKGTPACVGDTVANPDAMVLNYGQEVSLGGLTCRSEKTGMTCLNPAGHGFTLAKGGQKIF